MAAPSAPVSPNAQAVLQSAAILTHQRNREGLDTCLVATLAALPGIARAEIWRPHPGATPPGADMVVGSGDAPSPPQGPALVARAWTLGEEDFAVTADGHVVTCLPVLAERSGDAVAFVLVVGADTDGAPATLPLARGFVTIYANFLDILREAERDTLTGLKNRKTFDENINKVIGASRRLHEAGAERRRGGEPGDSHWLGILDIDHFKRVNDTFGHVFGDEVLLLFAALMRQVFRSNDMLFRFGGEEFVVVLAPTDPDHAARAFERFRQTVEAFAFPRVGRVTVSIGFVRIHPDDIAAMVIGQADEALYWAKRHGRNRVCRYEDLVQRGHLSPHGAAGSVELF